MVEYYWISGDQPKDGGVPTYTCSSCQTGPCHLCDPAAQVANPENAVRCGFANPTIPYYRNLNQIFAQQAGADNVGTANGFEGKEKCEAFKAKVVDGKLLPNTPTYYSGGAKCAVGEPYRAVGEARCPPLAPHVVCRVDDGAGSYYCSSGTCLATWGPGDSTCSD